MFVTLVTLRIAAVNFLRKVSIFSGKVAAKRRKQRSGEAEYKRPLLPPAAYPERELRCVVCWLLIICRNLKDLLPRLRIDWLLRALPDFGLSEDERKQSTTKQSIGTILMRWKKAGKIEQVEGLAKYRQLKKN